MEMRDFSEVLDELANKWVTLTSVEQNAVATAMAGTRQRENFNVLMENYDSYQEAIETATNSQGVAEEKYEAYMDSIEAHINKLKTAWESLVQTFEGSTFYKGFLWFATKLVEVLPYIIRQVVTLLTLFKGYKLPAWFANLAYMFNPKNSVASGKYAGAGKLWTARGQRDRRNIDKYQHYKKLSAANPDNEDYKAKMAKYEEKLPQGYKDQFVSQEVSPMVTQQQETNTTLRGIATNVQNLVSQNNRPVNSGGAIVPTTGNNSTFDVNVTNSGADPKVIKRFNDKDYSLRRYRLEALGNKGRAVNKLNRLKSAGASEEELALQQNVIDQSNTKIGFYDKAITENLEKRQAYLDSCLAKEKQITQQQQVQNAASQQGLNVAQQNLNTEAQITEEERAQEQATFQELANETASQQVAQQNLATETQIAQKEKEGAAASGQNAANKASGSKSSGGGKGKGGFGQWIKGNAGLGAMSGVTTAISAFATTEGDMTDKFVSAGLQGGLTAIGSVFGGPIGGMIGSIVGQVITGPILSIINAEENARKARVEEAQKQLEVLNKIDDSVSTAADLSSKDREDFSTENYQQLEEAYKELNSAMLSSPELIKEFNKQLDNAELYTNKYGSEVERASEALLDFRNGIGNTTKIVAAYSAAQKIQQAKMLMASQEEERDKLEETLNKHSYVKDYQNNKEAYDAEFMGILTESQRKEAEKLGIYDLEDYVTYISHVFGQKSPFEEYENAKLQYDALNDEVNQYYIEAALASSGVSSMSSVDIANTSLEGVIHRIAQEYAVNNPSIYSSSGILTEDARNEILALLRSDDKYASLLSGGNLTFGEVFNPTNEEKRQNLINKINQFGKDFGITVETFEDVINLASNGSQEALDTIKLVAQDMNTSIENIRDDIFNLDIQNLENFARALGMTTDAAAKYIDQLKGLSMEDVLGGVDSLNKRYDTLSEIFSDIAEDSQITQENLKKVVESYSYLLKGADGSLSYKNILGNLVDVLMGGADSESGIAYGSTLVQEAGTNQSYWNTFKEQYEDNWSAVFGDGVLSDEDIERLNAAKSLSDVQDLVKGNDLATQKWTEHLQNTISTLEVSQVLQEKIIKAEANSLETQINNLNSIKESLDDVNEQRKKEIELIKARDALENAKKEKKMVYRQGIGWTYEADQTAIQEANQNIEDLESQKTEEDLQYQIDELQRQLDMLNNIDSEKELQAAKDTLDRWGEKVSSLLGTSDGGSYLNQIMTFFSSDFQTKVKDAIIASGVANAGDLYSEDKVNALDDVKSARKALYEAEDAVNNAKEGTPDYNEQVAKYNEALKNYQSAVDAAKTYNFTDEDLENNGFETQDISDYKNAGSMEEKTEKMVEYKNVPKWVNEAFGDAHTKGKTNIIATGEAIYPSNSLLSRTSSVGAFSGGNGSQKMYKYVEGSGWSFIASGNDMKNYVSAFDDDNQYPPGVLVAFTTDNWSDAPRYVIKGTNGYWYAAKTYASGTLSASGGVSLINELGTEGIITPSGTVTALPSKSGIVPADLTRNLWTLGEVAPNLIKNLDSLSINYPDRSALSSDDHSTTIGNLYATFQADENFDFDQFLTDVRSAINLNRHIK